MVVNSVKPVLQDLLSSRRWFAPLGSENSHFFKFFTKIIECTAADAAAARSVMTAALVRLPTTPPPLHWQPALL
jgi:hypothetical protein